MVDLFYAGVSINENAMYNKQKQTKQMKIARAKYDYTASDHGELSFAANTLIGVVEADMTQQSWWVGAIWDEYRQVWSTVAGSIPSNFMAVVV
jgi:hypothetical protein